jgi:diguanylate cyclase (GGDEF)-like protein/PAS domain S-box-containing protein
MQTTIMKTGPQEDERLAALARMEIMDTEREPEFDELIETAAAICDAPISLVTLLDDKRQWFKAAVGLGLRETPREIAFCGQAIQQELLIVEDATKDARFADNPMVTGDEHIRFYAGMPIASPDGFLLGTLCVLDRVPRTLTATQVATLKVLGRQVNAQIELRVHRLHMQRALKTTEETKMKLTASERLFQTFMNSGPFMGFLKDTEGRFTYYNKLFAEKFGITQEEWIGIEDYNLFPPEMADDYRKYDQQVLETNALCVTTEPTIDADGTVSYWKTYKFPCTDADGAKLIGGVALDVTEELQRAAELQGYQRELEQANDKLQELAATDPLTGLANRRVFDERLAVEFAQAKRKKRDLSVLMLDLDRFKRRNDLYGHQQGDAALRQFARLLEECTRESDLAARYGGEEFVLLLPETDVPEAMQLANRILETVRGATWEDEPLTISIGAANFEPATTSARRLVNLADEALYAAKKQGRDRVVSYADYYRQVIAELDVNPS